MQIKSKRNKVPKYKSEKRKNITGKERMRM